MNNVFLYILTVFIWGSTWLAILFQLGTVPEELSIAYRFALASIVIFVFCWLTRKPLRFTPRQHVQAMLLGVTLFSANYFCFYLAEGHINSALTAIGFSTIMVMNIINARIWHKTPITPQVSIGAAIGLFGIATLFWPQITNASFGEQTLIGLGLCLLGSFSASMGNMISIKNQKLTMPITQTNAWGMAYGALFMALLAIVQGKEFVIEFTLSYWAALLYLSVFGSVIAFASYLTLLSRIGAHKTSYATILFPAVAVVISTFFEGFDWNLHAVIGFACILLGNVVLLIKPKTTVNTTISIEKAVVR